MLSNRQRKARLIVMFTLTFLYMIAELIVCYWGNATTLRTDAFHMLSDVIALSIGFIAIHLSPKKWEKNTFGWGRTEVLGALVNAVFLLALCFTIIMESIQKFITPIPISEIKLVLYVGGGGLVINLIGLAIFHEKNEVDHSNERKRANSVTDSIQDNDRASVIRNKNRLTRIVPPSVTTPPVVVSTHSPPELIKDGVEKKESEACETQSLNSSKLPKKRKSMNMRSVFLHLLADTANSVVVMVAAGTTLLVQHYIGEDYDEQTRWKWVNYVDPGLSVIIVFLICLSTWPLLQETSLILLQNVPPHLSVKALKRELLAEVKGISGVHEFHVWQLAGDQFYASIHVKCANADYGRISKEIKAFFTKQGIHETTVQAEFFAEGTSTTGQEDSANCLITVEDETITENTTLIDTV